MRLLSARLVNFLCHVDTRVDFGGIPVAVILGANEAGKTALVDGIRWGFENQARGKGGQTNRDLVRWGEKTCRVELVAAPTNGAEFALTRTPSSADSTQEAIRKAVGARTDEAIEAALDSGRFLSMAPKDRRALAFKAAGVVVDEPLLEKHGIDDKEVRVNAIARGFDAGERMATAKKREAGRALEVLTTTAPADEKISTDGGDTSLSALSADQVRQIAGEWRTARQEKAAQLVRLERDAAAAATHGTKRAAIERDLDVARKDLVREEERQAAATKGRADPAALRFEAETYAAAAAEAMPILAAPAQRHHVPGISAEERDVARLEAALARAKAGPWTRVVVIADSIDVRTRVEGRVEPNTGEPMEADTYPVEDLTAEMRELAKANGDDVAAIEVDLTKARGALANVREHVSRAQAANAKAEKADADAKASHARHVTDRNARVEVSRKARNGCLERAEAAAKIQAQDAQVLADARGAVRELEARLAGLAGAAVEAPTEDLVALREQIATADRRVDALDALARQVGEYHRARAAFDADEKKRAALRAEAARYERMEKALRPDGVVTSLTAVPLARLREVLAKVGPDVRVTDEWEVLYRDHPVTAASTSARWRVGAALAIALGAVSGLRFAILDEASVLVGKGLNTLVGTLIAAREHFDQVLVVASKGAEDLAAMRPVPEHLAPVLAYWKVVDGQVERIESKPAAVTAA